ncbi:MAG: metallophosphoesterase family protein [Candidatus Hydrothermales bacterium]
MRYLVLSDIHSNYEALDSVIKVANKEGYDEIICLGDIVGYGADPNLCADFIRENAKVTVLGNHDLALINPEERKNLNEFAFRAIEWTFKVIKLENKEFIKNLNFKEKVSEDLEIVHTAPSAPESFFYIFSLEEAIFEFQSIEKGIVFFGHTHVPSIYKRKKEGKFFKFGFKDIVYEKKNNYFIFKYRLEGDTDYLINPGSVGQPRDGDPRSSFMIYDSDKRELLFYRVFYDIDLARRKIIENGLPQFLGDRLLYGR